MRSHLALFASIVVRALKTHSFTLRGGSSMTGRGDHLGSPPAGSGGLGARDTGADAFSELAFSGGFGFS